VFNSSYTFSAKVRDLETSYSYFGARYYDATLSIWLSVDPLSDKYPSMSAYMYCAGNPVMLVDPDGMEIDEPVVTHHSRATTTYTYVGQENDVHIHRITESVTHKRTTMISDNERKVELTTTVTTTEIRRSRRNESTTSTQSQTRTEFHQTGTDYTDSHGYSGTIWSEVKGSRKNLGGYKDRSVERSRLSYNMRMQVGVLSDFIAENGYNSNYFQGDKRSNAGNALRVGAVLGVVSLGPYGVIAASTYVLAEYYKATADHSGKSVRIPNIKPL
jgi:RHS repeat-associated protein